MRDDATTALWTLSYVSRSGVPRDGPDIEAIRAVAQTRNVALDITGALYLDGKLFFQVIEGPRPGIEALMTSIRADTRHSDLRVVSQGPLRKRKFRQWSMKIVDAASLPAGLRRPNYEGLHRPDAEALARAMQDEL